MAGARRKRLVGMLHLPALPGSPRASLPMRDIEARALDEARILAEAGFDGCVIENFGDTPFHEERVEPVTIAAMTRVVATVRRELADLRLGVNVLRNDARAALSIAAAAGAHFVRVNVHVGVTATDQGILEGRAAETLRLRRGLAADIEIWADVHVKHGRSLAHREITHEAADAVQRGLADALIVTGGGTGWTTEIDDLRAVRGLTLGVPVYVGSGVTERNVGVFLKETDGVIVGTSLKVDGCSSNPLDAERVRRFVEAARQPSTP
ncbi:MAG: BtpA/SgcQ family protein [Candidatus Krumholzibacteriia bacterium]